MPHPSLQEVPLSYLTDHVSKVLDFDLLDENGKVVFASKTQLDKKAIQKLEREKTVLYRRSVKGRPLFDPEELQRMTEETAEIFSDIRKSGVLQSSAFENTRKQYDKVLRNLEPEAIKDGYIQLSSTMSQLDNHSYRHAVNTGSLALIFGTKLRIPRSELLDLVQSAYYFDIGLTKVPEELLLKMEYLDDRERKALEDHTALGYRILHEFQQYNQDMTSALNAKLTALMHHVKYNGRGYPTTMNVNGEEIKLAYNMVPLFTRMTSVCDLYCALTEERPHRSSLENDKALKMILNESLNSYDIKVVHDFINQLGLALNYNEPFYKRYDVVVLLSSHKAGRDVVHQNEFAIVDNVHNNNLMRPVVNLVYNAKTKKKLNKVRVDLRRDPSRKMIRIVEDTKLADKIHAIAS